MIRTKLLGNNHSMKVFMLQFLKVIGLNTKNKTIVMKDNTIMMYDSVLIATGSK